MKPYDDPDCKCHEIEDEIRKKYPDCNWNIDEACSEWIERSKELEVNEIEFEPHSDECYGCTCPTCGRMICGWCV
jgi:hypothetical protein